jgi:hypothetical protein
VIPQIFTRVMTTRLADRAHHSCNARIRVLRWRVR